MRRLPRDKRHISRVHSDQEKAILGGELNNYIQQKGWWQTSTEGYDSNGNSRVEGRNAQVRALMRPAMVTATGGNSYSQEIWDELAMHGSNTILLNTPCAGGKSPIEKTGGTNMDLEKESHVPGAKCIYYEAKERRTGAHSDRGVVGVWLGHSDTVIGGHRVAQVEWIPNRCAHIVHPAQDRVTVKVDDDCMLLKKVVPKGDAVYNIDSLVDRFSSAASPSEVYEVKKIWDHKERKKPGGAVEKQYLVQWKGYRKNESTWEPESNLEDYGAAQILNVYKQREGLNVYSTAVAVDMEVYRAVVQLMGRHRLKGSVQKWMDAYVDEFEQVSNLRLRELSGEEYNRVAKAEKVIPLRMNPEPDRQTNGENKQKMRLLVRGDLEPKEWNRGKSTDAPTANASSVKMILALADQEGGEQENISIGDISKAFIKSWLYGPEEHTRYVSLTMYKGGKKKIFELLGSLYGQVDAGHRWYSTLKAYLEDNEGMKCSKNDPCLFIHPTTKMKFVVHTDDVCYRGLDKHTKPFWNRLREKFGLKHVEYVSTTNSPTYCGIRISMTEEGGKRRYHMDQNTAMKEFLADNIPRGLRPVGSPMPNKSEMTTDSTVLGPADARQYRSQLMGAAWFANMTRIDIAHPVNRLAQFMAKPTEGARKALTRVMAYLQGRPELTLNVCRSRVNTYEFYVDSDHAGDTPTSARSTTGIVLMLNGMPVSWTSKKQPMTALSSTVAEVYAFSEAVKQAQFLIWRMEDVGHLTKLPIQIKEDNQATISFQKATKTTTKLRGIFNLRWHWVQELRDIAKVIAVKVHTDDNLADLLTKCHLKPTLDKFIRRMNIST
jgi:hypothetical protein